MVSEWSNDLSYFLAGALTANGIPHFVSGVLGRAFQSPFAKPPGKGLSSSRINVLWGFLNFALAYALLFRVGDFQLSDVQDASAAGLGVLLMALICAHIFGRLHGGIPPRDE